MLGRRRPRERHGDGVADAVADRGPDGPNDEANRITVTNMAWARVTSGTCA